MLTDLQQALLMETAEADGRIERANYRPRGYRGSVRAPVRGEKAAMKKLVELGLASVCTISRSWWKGSEDSYLASPSVTIEFILTDQGMDVARGLL